MVKPHPVLFVWSAGEVGRFCEGQHSGESAVLFYICSVVAACHSLKQACQFA